MNFGLILGLEKIKVLLIKSPHSLVYFQIFFHSFWRLALSLALGVKNIIFLFQMVDDPLQLLRIKCVADEQGDGVLGNFINTRFG